MRAIPSLQSKSNISGPGWRERRGAIDGMSGVPGLPWLRFQRQRSWHHRLHEALTAQRQRGAAIRLNAGPRPVPGPKSANRRPGCVLQRTDLRVAKAADGVGSLAPGQTYGSSRLTPQWGQKLILGRHNGAPMRFALSPNRLKHLGHLIRMGALIATNITAPSGRNQFGQFLLFATAGTEIMIMTDSQASAAMP